MVRYCEYFNKNNEHLWVMYDFITRDQLCYYCNLFSNEKLEKANLA